MFLDLRLPAATAGFWLFCSLMATLPMSLDALLFCRLTVLLPAASFVGSAAGGGSGGVGILAGDGAGGTGAGAGGIGVATGWLGTNSVLVVCFCRIQMSFSVYS